MSTKVDLVLKGPPTGPLPNCSLGEYLVQKMKLLPQDQIIQVDGDTGATQTVGEVFEMAARLSEGLRNLGLKQGEVVVMMCRNGFESTAIVLGSWLSAAVIVPLNTTLKVAEMKYAFELTQPKFIFCEEEAVNNASTALDLLLMTAKIILVEDTNKPQDTRPTFREILAKVDVCSFLPQSVESPSTELVTILFSSGSTGLPKGVGITHTNFIFQDQSLKLLSWFKGSWDFLAVSQFFWVTAHFFLIHSLSSGMKRVLLKRPTLSNILKAVEEHKPRWSMMAPLFALSITNHPDFDKVDVSSLKVILVGGSPFTSSMGEKFKRKWKDVCIVQCYGLTEATGTICIVGEKGDPYSVGRVVPGLQVKVVDISTREPLKPNAFGEICVKSPGIMRGYVKNEKGTREVLDEEGWLRTGDVGYYKETKEVYLVDRLKEVVKITDMQVSPSEVENTILSIQGVLEAFVTGVTHDGSVFELMAIVVKEKDSAVTEEVIRTHGANTLSDYKRLTAGVHFAESLPKTANGKLERTKLRKMAQELYSKKPK